MFGVDDKDIKRYEKDLQTLKSRAYPFATKATLNKAAFTAQKIARARLQKQFVIRNKFTPRSVRVQMARGLKVNKQESIVGSDFQGLRDQELGATKSRTGSEGVAIPTSFSAGQGMKARPRTRLPRKANKLQSIQLKRNRRKGATKGQRNFIAVKQAASSGSKFVFLDLERRKGIFKVIGNKKRPKVRMVFDLTRQSVRISPRPWLAPTVDAVQQQIPGFYRDALVFQLKRHKIFLK